MTFGEKLKLLRVNKGLKQKEAAAAVGALLDALYPTVESLARTRYSGVYQFYGVTRDPV